MVATERACGNTIEKLHGNQLGLQFQSIKLIDGSILELSDTNPIVHFNHQDCEFYLAPVLSCLVPKQTVGLGDYISASALGVELL